MESKGLPLYVRFPAMLELPRAALGTFPSPVDAVEVEGAGRLWLKRDDWNAPVAAGNKVRALEFLLGSVRPGDLVLTAGGEGSTHVYATAAHAARLGARTVAIRWRQDMHPVAYAVGDAATALCEATTVSRWPALAFLRLGAWRAGLDVAPRVPAPREAGSRPARHYVPVGGSSPRGVLGHVNAGLELAAQVAAGVLPEPTHIVVPLGSGGTAAGMALGLGIAGMRSTVVAARVAPRIASNAMRIAALIRGTRRLIRRLVPSAEALPAAPVRVDQDVYGGAYGRPLAAGTRAVAHFAHAYSDLEGARLPPPVLEATYAAKAAAAALALAAQDRRAHRVLLWVTFDGREFVTAHEGWRAAAGVRAGVRA